MCHDGHRASLNWCRLFWFAGRAQRHRCRALAHITSGGGCNLSKKALRKLSFAEISGKSAKPLPNRGSGKQDRFSGSLQRPIAPSALAREIKFPGSGCWFEDSDICVGTSEADVTRKHSNNTTAIVVTMCREFCSRHCERNLYESSLPT